jgi:hypothetical protein
MEKNNERTLFAVVFNPKEKVIYYNKAFRNRLFAEIDCLVELARAGAEKAGTTSKCVLKGLYGIVYDGDNEMILCAYTGTNEKSNLIKLDRREFPSIQTNVIVRDILLRKLYDLYHDDEDECTEDYDSRLN